MINVQESPDLYCGVEELERIFLNEALDDVEYDADAATTKATTTFHKEQNDHEHNNGNDKNEVEQTIDNIIEGGDFSRVGTKIIHFVRNPYSMALSNYYYHAQIPT